MGKEEVFRLYQRQASLQCIWAPGPGKANPRAQCIKTDSSFSVFHWAVVWEQAEACYSVLCRNSHRHSASAFCWNCSSHPRLFWSCISYCLHCYDTFLWNTLSGMVLTIWGWLWYQVGSHINFKVILKDQTMRDTFSNLYGRTLVVKKDFKNLELLSWGIYNCNFFHKLWFYSGLRNLYVFFCLIGIL